MDDEAQPERQRQVDDNPESQHHAKESGSGKDREDSAPLPFSPHKDDESPLGDTDQHSDA
jgi:hypothetical protein